MKTYCPRRNGKPCGTFYCCIEGSRWPAYVVGMLALVAFVVLLCVAGFTERP